MGHHPTASLEPEVGPPYVGVLENTLGLAVGDQHAEVEYGQAISQAGDDIDVVLDQDDTRARRGPQFQEKVGQVISLRRSQAGERLIEQQYHRSSGQGHGQFDQPRLAEGEGSDIGLGQPGNPHLTEEAGRIELDRLGCARSTSNRPQAPGDVQGELHVFPHGQIREQGDPLKGPGQTQARPLVHRGVRALSATHDDPPLARTEQSRHHVQQRRLPGAVGTDDSDDLTRAHAKAHVAQGLQAPETHRHVVHVQDEGRISGFHRNCNHRFAHRSPAISSPAG